MSSTICPNCGATVNTEERCPKCQAATAIALGEPTPPLKTPPPVVTSATAISEGPPPMPAPLPRRAKSPGIVERVVRWSLLLALAGTLVGLLAPAILKVREARNRTQSTNNLKQIGLAAQAFHDANRRLPFNGSGVAVGNVGYSREAMPQKPTSGSWGFQIAPFIDQREMFDAGKSDVAIPAYLCPGRNRYAVSQTPALGATTPPWSDYVINAWLNDNHHGTADAPDAKRTQVGITDGTSNTIMFGHGQIRPADYWASESVPGYLDTILLGGTTATALSSNPAFGPVTFARDSSETRTDAARGFGSPFPQGCLMAMCDGTVRMFPYSMKVGTFSEYGGANTSEALGAFLTPTGGEVVTRCDD